jgi:predicted nucleotidyltransferase
VYDYHEGTFTDINAGLPGNPNSRGTWGDYDNDRNIDILFTGALNTTIFRNNITVFPDIGAGMQGVLSGSTDWGDYDNDGDLDVLLTGLSPGTNFPLSRIYRNDNGLFTDIAAQIPDVSNSSADWGDYDNDGDLDILLTGSSISRIYRNDNGSFYDIAAGLPNILNGSASWGDFDNDGDPDILLTGSYLTKIFRNNNGIFTEIPLSIPGVSYSSSEWGDYDNDGDLDIAISGISAAGNMTRIYRNNNGNFTEIVTDIAGVGYSSLAWGDYDNDGDLDLVVTGKTSSGEVTKIYRNCYPVSNTAPAAPSNLQAVVGANKVVLSWDKPSDSSTPQPALSYNIYIGTTAGSVDRKAPMAIVPGGYRKIVQKGSAINSFTIKNLPYGTYYWSVQAIDNSFAGSPFAGESNFNVTYSTSISPKGDQTLIINQSGTPLTVTVPSSADSHQWRYSTTSGGPYDHVIAGATGISYTPSFPDWGTYYVICESVKNGVTYSSNEVRISIPVFTEQTGIYLDPVYQSSAAWGDYDNDGDLDLFLAGYYFGARISKIYSNNSGSFTDTGASIDGVNYSSAGWGDYDNDGDLDLLISGRASSGRISKIYQNNAGSFTDINAGLPGAESGTSAWGDFDSDGDLDILITGYNISRVIRNDNGVFTDINAGLPGVNNSSSAWGDYDNDGDLDIVITGYNQSGAYISAVFRNDNGLFTDIIAGLTGVQYSSVAWGDYDNDSDLDLLITGYTGSSAGFISKIYRNDNGIFPDINAGLPGVRWGSSAWGDYDNDGDLDIIISGYNQTSNVITRIYRNDAGSFSDINAALPGLQYSSCAWGDYDKDGDLDILLAGQRLSGYFSGIYKNNMTVPNTVPSMPTGLTANVSNSNRVTLSWTKSTDNKTPQNGLSYNAYIGTSPSTVNKLSPMAAIPGGFRKIPLAGKIQKNSHVIKHLPAGTYYWSIQAVDNSFAGSAFATEGMFTVTFSNRVGPATPQTLAISQNGTQLTVTESAVPTSRQWKYSLTSGGPYNNTIPGATGTSYIPNFASFGNFFVVCEAIQGGIAYTSNEVKISVPVFTEQQSIVLDAVKYSSVAWGDYDNDSDPDILLTGNNPLQATTKLYNNNGGVFTETASAIPGLYLSSASWGDYDNDGDIDALVSGYSGSDHTMIFRNDAGLFTDINAGIQGIEWGTTSWGDYDNDGDLDILLSGSNQGSIYRNDIGVFFNIGANLAKVVFSSSAWGDFDNDGDQDILLTGLSGSEPLSRIYRNDAGNFVDINAGLAGVSYSTASWSDYDNDGDLDILISGMSAYSPISKIYRNDGGGTFTDINASLVGVYRGSAAWGDYDNDGDPDILLTGFTTSGFSARIYRNNAGSFSDIDEPLAGVQYSSVAWCDYDKDGDLDILLTGSGNDSPCISKIYKNNTAVSNTAPTPPSKHQPVMDANRTTLSWDKSTDNNTPQDGLTYNLYIGTSPGSVNKKSPMSSLPGGYRRIVGRGIQSTSWSIKNLPAGTYYWNVQAIDNSYSGSSFAAEGNFSVVYSNSITPVAPQVLLINQSGTILTVNETSPADSRQWRYSTVSGGPYDNVIPGATGTSCTPLFSQWGNYYMVCVSTKNSISYTSNEVRISLPVFIEQTEINLAGVYRGSVAWGDYDSDGDLDLFITGINPQTGSISVIYRNDNGTFIDVGAGLPALYQSSAAWGDYDNDGDIDLVLSGYSTSSNYLGKIYRNDAGLFTDIAASIVPTNAGTVAWADYDNDGDLDLLSTGAASTTSYVSKIYRNDNGEFIDIDAALTGVTGSSAAWGDFDKDGDKDILLTGMIISGEKISRIYRNDNGSFVDINASLTGVYNSSSAWGDLDNDGDLDLLLSGISNTSDRVTKVFRNDGGTFIDILASLPGIVVGSVAWGDFDNDGDNDILLSGSGTTGYMARVFRNTAGTFSEMDVNIPGASSTSLAWGDYDNDGDLDVVFSGMNGSSYITKVYKNTGVVYNTAPTVPANLAASSQGSSSVLLSWGKSTDGQTPQDALTYNLRVGTTPGGSDIISPMSVSSGYRGIVSRGNAESRNTGFFLTGLLPGTYFWNVQAVDQAYTGGQWSAQSSFVLLTAPLALPATNLAYNRFTANWNTVPGALGYVADVATDAGFTSPVTGYNGIDAGNVTSLNVTGLGANTQYFYRIRARNADGASILVSNTITVTTLKTPPAIPSGLTASSCNDLVNLSWNANSEPDFLIYRIYGGTTDNPSIKIDSIAGISNTTKPIEGLIHNQTYYFRITGVSSSGGESSFSPSVSATVKKGVVPRIKAKFEKSVMVCYNIGDSIASFQWYRNSTPVGGQTKQYHATGKIPGSYSVMTTDKNGCKNSSNIIIITSSGNKSLSLYPNPAKDIVTLSYFSELSGKATVSFYNQVGVKLLEYLVDKPDPELMVDIPVANLPDGVYTIEIIVNEEEITTTRVVVSN